ncbi:MAG: 6-phosphofructokinase [Candidatus Caenarcaniphilales bacterium]|nr:6-phosphofructokinase [Candidatus Caenarcaniphilales bacterium]
MKALFIFDGGLAPGYTAVAVGLTEEGEYHNWECWAARSGFRSLCSGFWDEPQFVRVVTNPIVAFELNSNGLPTEMMGRKIFFPGSDFRSERYPEFAQPENQKLAAQMIIKEGFEVIVFCGGDGTLRGAKALSKYLPSHIRTGFINISADSDITHDRSVGFLSCAEQGAHIARGLYEDAFTHQRIYFLEMMGNKSGRHALHSGAAARAHLIVLPVFDFPDEVMREIADTLRQRRHALVVVAEGYKKDYRREQGIKLDAASFFKKELEKYDLFDTPQKRLIAEPFSRYLRGVTPLMIDCEIAHLKCQILVRALQEGQSGQMVYYVSEHNMGLQPFSDANSDNTIEKEFVHMIDRLDIPKFRDYAFMTCSSKTPN